MGAAQAFFSSSHGIKNGGRKTATSNAMVLVTPDTYLRRSARLCNDNFVNTIQPRNVRLFQESPTDGGGTEYEIESNNKIVENKDELEAMKVVDLKQLIKDSGLNERGLFSKLKRKRDMVDFLINHNNNLMATKVSTPAPRSSRSIPVTPEPPASDDSNRQSSRKKAKTNKTKSRPKTVESWPAPDGWRETYEMVRELRKDKTAPCDFMGAEALAQPAFDKKNPNGIEDVDEEEYAKISRFQVLIALMLSSQTKDAMVGKAMENLRDEGDGSGGLTVPSILAMDPKMLNTKIYSVGFRNNKTKYIKQAAQILHDDYNDDIPPTAAEMIDLPGVGPKMAYIVENICWDKQTGIGVDTHMQRLFPKLGWVSPDTKNPEQTRKQLESWLPHEYWGEVNLLWVGFGQEVQQERGKILRKALQSSDPIKALRLLHSVDFKVWDEWNKILNGEEKNFPWKNDKQKVQMVEMVEKECHANE